MKAAWVVVWLLLGGSAMAASPAVEALTAGYRAAGATAGSAAAGKAMWTKEVTAADGSARSCATCHTADPKAAGKHKTTGEVIDPLAPSVNATRLTDGATIEKWFGRNCKWTYGRECTPQEKSDFLAWIQQ